MTTRSTREAAVGLLLDALKVYSPSGGEAPLAELLSDRMRGQFGFRNVRVDGAGNVLGEVGSGDLHLLLCGHMDTVPGEIPVRLDGDTVCGRGAVDAKGPLCAMIIASSLLKQAGLRVTLAAVTREEGDSLGVNHLIEQGGDYDFAVFGEPAGAAKVTVGYRGRVAAHVTVTTEGGHASSPWAHTSAVDKAMLFLDRVREYESQHAVEGNRYRSLSTCLTLIEGGSFPNVVPATCRMTLDIRVPPGMNSAQAREALTWLAREQSAKDRAAKLELEFEEATEPYECDPGSVLVRAFQRSIIKSLGERPTMVRKTGTGDMNTLAHRLSIPVLTYGPGESRLEHTTREAITIPDYLRSVEVLRGAFDEILELSRSGS